MPGLEFGVGYRLARTDCMNDQKAEVALGAEFLVLMVQGSESERSWALEFGLFNHH